VEAEFGAYLGLFAAAFGAASLLPLSSEPVLMGLQLAGYPPPILWSVATTGNTLGSVLNWWIARQGLRFQDRDWFPVEPTALARATAWFQRYGVWSLLLAWAPVVGDALTVVAGLTRVRLDLFVVLVGLGKGLRYAALVWMTGAAA